MTTDNKIHTIQRLLDSYYEATISDDELKLLLRMLASADDLPADLKAERDMLLALHSMPRHDIAREESRQALTASLDSMARKGRHRSLRIAVAALLSAACVALILAVGFRIGIPASDDTPSVAAKQFTASATATACDTIPQRIIRLAADTLAAAAPAPKAMVTETAARHREIARAAIRDVKKCVTDTMRIADAMRRQQSIDAETMQLVADILTTVQSDYTTTIQMMDEINETYSSAVLIPANLKSVSDNKPLPAI